MSASHNAFSLCGAPISHRTTHLQSTWKYDKNGDDFDAKVGRILSHGVDLRVSVSCATSMS